MIPSAMQIESHGQHWITGSYGSLLVDGTTGDVLRYQSESEDEYANIVRFNVDEYVAYNGAMDDTDILLIGFWNEDGLYEPPVIEERERRANRI